MYLHGSPLWSYAVIIWLLNDISVTGFTYYNSSYSVNGLGDHHMGDLLKP